METAVLKALAKDPQSQMGHGARFAQALSGKTDRLPASVEGSTSRMADAYEVGEVIGRGRLGSHIYKGIHRATRHEVAIRVIRRGQDTEWETARTRFMREARLAPVNHPSILRVRDYGEEHDLVYVVTDFVPGSSLREVMDREGAFAWNDGRALLLDLIGATCALHTHGLLAFGLTPSIIRLATSGNPARLVISSAGMSEIHEVFTRTGVQPVRGQKAIDGDAFYLAPELLFGEKPDGRTDIFMIGVIGYELFTGHRPFKATTVERLVAAELAGKVIDPRKYAPQLPCRRCTVPVAVPRIPPG